MKKLDSTTLRKIELGALVILTLLAFALFRNASLDLWAARLFYHPDNVRDPWFEQSAGLWEFFYHAAPWLTSILLFASLAVLAGSLFKTRFQARFRALRLYAVYIFLVVALGPGLFVNAVFKPYWGRPRPREVVELGGKAQYRPFYTPSVGSPGKSFPCGHCSVAFAYGSLWFLLRRKRPALASATLLGSIGFGVLMGIGRIAAGGHFFSDVYWSGLITLWVSFWLYHHALKIPLREGGLNLGATSRISRISRVIETRKTIAVSLYGALGVLTLLTLLVASPFHKEIDLPQRVATTPTTANDNLKSLRLEIDRADIELILDTDLAEPFQITGFAKGFGFPGNKVNATCETLMLESRCSVNQKGFFSDFESRIRVIINPNRVMAFRLKLHRGEVYRDRALPADYFIN